MLRKSEIETNRRDHDAIVKAYDNNKNKLRSMALGQCDKCIQAIIKAHPDYSNNQYNLIWILKRIKLASKEQGISKNVIYLQLVSGVCCIFRFYKNLLTFNKYHQQITGLISTLADRDVVIRLKCASDWEASKHTGIM